MMKPMVAGFDSPWEVDTLESWREAKLTGNGMRVSALHLDDGSVAQIANLNDDTIIGNGTLDGKRIVGYDCEEVQ